MPACRPYTGGVDSAAAGAAKLQNGAASLQNGASSLYAGASRLADGTATLSSGASALIDGVTALRDGAMQLSDGLKQLNEEGFQKLVDAMDGDVEPLLERARALAGISGDYQTLFRPGRRNGRQREVHLPHRGHWLSQTDDPLSHDRPAGAKLPPGGVFVVGGGCRCPQAIVTMERTDCVCSGVP